MIDPRLDPEPLPFDENILQDMSGAEVIPTDDGGVEVTFDQQEEQEPPIPFDANLAEVMDQRGQAGDIQAVGSELLELIRQDDASRGQWKEAYKRGIDLLGICPETAGPDYIGISTVRHPLMALACIRFWSEARAELLPASGPCKTAVMGDPTPEVEDQAERVETYINYWATEEAKEYYPEDSQALFYVPLGGCVFKKVYPDPLLMRVTSRFIMPDDLIVAYTVSDMSAAQRITQRLRYTKGDLRKLQLSQFYRDVSLGQPLSQTTNRGEVQEKVDEQQGIEPAQTTVLGDDEYTLYECHTKLDLKGFEHTGPDGQPTGIPLPYIVTLDADSGMVLAIRRNWQEQDPKQTPEAYFVKFPFLPGLGFYNLGFAHLLGGISEAATALLRIMIDAGLFGNFQGGLKAKGLGLDANALLVKPGQYVDVDVPSGNLRDNIMSLPYKGIDQATLAMYVQITQEGEKLASTAQQPTGEMNPNAPVGTTIAILDEAQKIKASIMRDLHVARREELRLVAKYLGRTLPDRYPYNVRGQQQFIARQDFDDRVDVIPVSDLEATSKTQRLAIAQAKMQLAMTLAPMGVNINMNEVAIDMLAAMGVNDHERIIPPPPEAITADPATENVMALQGRPIMANPMQDHMSHIAAHMGFLNMVGMNPAFAPAMMKLGPMLQSHVMEHFAQYYMTQMQVMTGAPIGQPIPPQLEMQLAGMIAQITPQIAAQIPQLPGITAPGTDPMAAALVQVETEKVKQKREEAAQDYDLGVRKLDVDKQKAAANLQGDLMKTSAQLQSQEKQTATKLVVDLTKDARAGQRQAQEARAGRAFQAGQGAVDRAHQSGQSAQDKAFQFRQGIFDKAHQSQQSAAERAHQANQAYRQSQERVATEKFRAKQKSGGKKS